MRKQIITCPHQNPSEIKGGFKCTIGLYGGFPYIGNCLKCLEGGQNNAEYVQSLESTRRASHPQERSLVSGCCDSAENYIDRIAKTKF